MSFIQYMDAAMMSIVIPILHQLKRPMANYHQLVALIAPHLCLAFLLLLLLLVYFCIAKRSRKVFLLDFSCYKPPINLMCSKQLVVQRARLYGNFTEEILEYMKKVLERAGLGDSTYLAKALLREPPNPCMDEARGEAEMVMFGAIDDVLEKTGVQIQDIRVLVVNCSIFNTVPSLSSMIMNRYKFRDDIACYNLGGMGCTAGLWAIVLAKELLQVHDNCYALVVSTENITENCYYGKDRSKFLINCLFRVGGAAVMLSNRGADRKSSKYQLVHTVQTHTANFDRAYSCIFQEEDEEGVLGITITKDLMVAAIKAIESNLILLGPLILPISEKILLVKSFIMRRIFKVKVGVYLPNFNKCIDHFFPHVGGKPVLDELQKVLGFNDANMEASRMTLHRFGNTSSSSVWYELAYAEAKGRINKGDHLWQIAFGSGFKCCSVIWRAMKTISYEETNPWSSEIDGYPITSDNSEPFPYKFEPSK